MCGLLPLVQEGAADEALNVAVCGFGAGLVLGWEGLGACELDLRGKHSTSLFALPEKERKASDGWKDGIHSLRQLMANEE